MSDDEMKSYQKPPIKTMHLYNHLDRIAKELEVKQVAINVENLSEYDSMHYLGNHAVENSVSKLSIAAQSSILDIGSGLGGPARLLAHWTGCSVDALELQNDLHQAAVELTKQCDLSSRVCHLQGNILEFDVGTSKSYDGIVSWLVFLHISNRSRLYQQCFDSLKSGGRMYVEDYVRQGTFTQHERDLLRKEVYVQHELPTKEETRQELQAAGFKIVELIDVSKAWKEYTQTRHERYRSELRRHQSVQGEQAANNLLHFYESIDTLFQGTTLGGVAYVVQKP